MHKPVPEAFLTAAFEACELKAAEETTSNRSQTHSSLHTRPTHLHRQPITVLTYMSNLEKIPKHQTPPPTNQVFPTMCHFCKVGCMFWLWQVYTFPSLLAKVRTFHTLNSTLKHDLSNHHSPTANRISTCIHFPPNKTMAR